MTTLGKANGRQMLSAAFAETKMRLIIMIRQPGVMVLDVIIPLVVAAIPMLMGRAIAGEQISANFAANTGTDNYPVFMLIGACAFNIVAAAFSNLAYWLRAEQETGTLEAIYLTPTSSLVLAAGISLYSAIRSFGLSFISYVIGCLIFGVNPFLGSGIIAFIFILIGILPLYSLTFLFGALILKTKEANALVGLMQWLVSFFIGVAFPVVALPPLARALALLFPPTWIVNGVRSALLGVSYIFEVWYWDVAILGVFLLFIPYFSIWVFRRVERGVRQNEGMGIF